MGRKGNRKRNKQSKGHTTTPSREALQAPAGATAVAAGTDIVDTSGIKLSVSDEPVDHHVHSADPSKRIGDRLEEYRLLEAMRESQADSHSVQDANDKAVVHPAAAAAPAPVQAAVPAGARSAVSAGPPPASVAFTGAAGAGAGVGAGSAEVANHYTTYGWRTGPEAYDDEVVHYDNTDGAVRILPDGRIETADRLGAALNNAPLQVDSVEIADMLADADLEGAIKEEPAEAAEQDTIPHEVYLQAQVLEGDVLVNVASFLEVFDLGRLAQVNKRTSKASGRSSIWRPRCQLALKLHSRSSMSTFRKAVKRAKTWKARYQIIPQAFTSGVYTLKRTYTRKGSKDMWHEDYGVLKVVHYRVIRFLPSGGLVYTSQPGNLASAIRDILKGSSCDKVSFGSHVIHGRTVSVNVALPQGVLELELELLNTANKLNNALRVLNHTIKTRQGPVPVFDTKWEEFTFRRVN